MDLFWNHYFSNLLLSWKHFYRKYRKLTKNYFLAKSRISWTNAKKSLLFDLERFFYSIFDYLVYFQPHELLLEVFTEINLISVYKLEFIEAFQRKFKEIDEKKLSTKNLNGKQINKTALFHIFKVFSLSIIFPFAIQNPKRSFVNNVWYGNKDLIWCCQPRSTTSVSCW